MNETLYLVQWWMICFMFGCTIGRTFAPLFTRKGY